MNILFIGPYRQTDGWGIAAKHYLSCLLKTEHNVSCSPIYMGDSVSHELSKEILTAEKLTLDSYDVVIQNVLPGYFEKQQCHTIGIYFSETYDLNNSSFIDKINEIDELWVSSTLEKDSLKESGVNIKITVIPVPLDVDNLNKYDKVDKLDIPNVQNNLVFYMLAEYVERKNLLDGVLAFNREFCNNENVSLLIKTSRDKNQRGKKAKIENDIVEMKTKLRMFNNLSLYNNEIIITERISEEQLMSVHQTGDCLLVPSYGESICQPALEALFFNNNVICTDNIYTCDILGEHCDTVESMKIPVQVDNPPLRNIYTGWETWNKISVIDMQKKMRAFYNKSKNQVKLNRGSSREYVINNFSYEVVANKIKERLCQL